MEKWSEQRDFPSSYDRINGNTIVRNGNKLNRIYTLEKENNFQLAKCQHVYIS